MGKIRSVHYDNRRKAFQVVTSRKTYFLPYVKVPCQPTRENPVTSVCVDEELGGEAFTYALASGEEGTVHIEQVLDYNRDPRYLRDMLLYKLTLVAREQMESNALSKREIIRRLGTSPAQLYRLLDPANSTKSIDRLMALLAVLDCEVDLIVKQNQSGPSAMVEAS